MTIKAQSVLPQYSSDISETQIREEMPEILQILLSDRTTSYLKHKKCYIIWANDNYLQYGQDYNATAPIQPNLIIGDRGKIIMPRALKSAEQQKERTKSQAEVFTPLWMVKKQNDEIEQDYLSDDLETYIKRTWLELACGEAPYIASRYNPETGEIIPLEKRVGFLDRKLQRINNETHTKKQWQRLVTIAYQACYGFEWNGDSLLLARENVLYSCRDYYLAKWNEEIPYAFFKKIANIISYNLFQMDGIDRVIPFSRKEDTTETNQLTLFLEKNRPLETGTPIKIKNWQTRKLEYFDKE